LITSVARRASDPVRLDFDLTRSAQHLVGEATLASLPAGDDFALAIQKLSKLLVIDPSLGPGGLRS